jgi:hypothetical protein
MVENLFITASHIGNSYLWRRPHKILRTVSETEFLEFQEYVQLVFTWKDVAAFLHADAFIVKVLTGSFQTVLILSHC